MDDNIDGEQETTGFKILLATAVRRSSTNLADLCAALELMPPGEAGEAGEGGREGRALSFMTSAQSAFAAATAAAAAIHTDPARQSRIDV